VGGEYQNGCNNMLRAQGYRKRQEILIDDYGAMVEW
jgi:hypothetical protein